MSERSYQKELLDDLTVPFEEIQLNMRELNLINHWLGGHHITVEGIRKLLGKQLSGNPLVLEIGCGGGDNLKVVNKWCRGGAQANKTKSFFFHARHCERPGSLYG